MRAEIFATGLPRILRCQCTLTISLPISYFQAMPPANASAPLNNTRKASRLHCDGLEERLMYFYSKIFPTIFRVMSWNLDGRNKFPYTSHSPVSFFVPFLLFLPSFFPNIFFFPFFKSSLIYRILIPFLSLFPLCYLVNLPQNVPFNASSVILVTTLC